MKEALVYPSKSTFAQVTGLTNRPLSLRDSKLPQDERLQLVSGIDLTGSVEQVVSAMKEKIKGIETVTHVIFTAYIEKPDFETLRTVNVDLLKTAITAVAQLAPKLQSVTLQTGGKAYGVEFSKDLELKTPFKESQPRIPKPYYDNIFYYPQHDALASLASNKSWTFSEVRPDVIIGFTPGSNFMNCAQGLGIWLSLAREVKGAGAEIPFPGTKDSWRNKHTDTFQDVLGRMDIFAAVNRKKCGDGGTFNCADGEVVTCKYYVRSSITEPTMLILWPQGSRNGPASAPSSTSKARRPVPNPTPLRTSSSRTAAPGSLSPRSTASKKASWRASPGRFCTSS